MAVSTPSSKLGHHVFGAATLASGLITLAWYDSGNRHALHYVVLAAAIDQIVGGALIQVRRTTKTGASVIGAAYLVSSLLCLPQIIAAPRVYISWGNFFEQFSLLTGAAIVYAHLASVSSSARVSRIGCILLGICTVSFALEQAFYIGPTATLVPKWIPPSQMFWAIATTIFFALAALALLANRMALLATRLLTLMIASFGLIVWIPLIVSHPRDHANWSETAETFAIAGVAWVLADLLREYPVNKTQ